MFYPQCLTETDVLQFLAKVEVIDHTLSRLTSQELNHDCTQMLLSVKLHTWLSLNKRTTGDGARLCTITSAAASLNQC